MLASTTAQRLQTKNGRARLLAGCAISVALGALSQAPHAGAQVVAPNKSFQGTGVFSSGTGTVVQGATQDTITVNSSQAIIDWTLDDTATGGGPITFLPNGRTGLFTNGTAVNDYVVLNRIVPTDQSRAIRFDGTVRSQIQGAAGGPPQTGGSVWFYSPGGIIAGASSVFDVGNLVLTSNAIDTTDGLFGSNGEIRFRGAANGLSSIQIDSGAQIRALAEGSYVAMVAPRIVQNGDVQVNGSVGYVAAEEADVTINNGLFDIAFLTGTSDGQAISHGGSTGGPASTGFGDNHRIYFATIAKNDAVSMLLTGSIGYQPAASAFIQNGVVILSAGQDVEDGNAFVGSESSRPGGSIEIGNSSFTSAVTGAATDSITVRPTGAGTISFTDASLSAGNSVEMGVGDDQLIAASGSVFLNAVGNGDGTHSARVYALDTETGYGGGAITIQGSLGVSATDFATMAGGGRGGQAVVEVDRGSLTVGQTLQISADAYGPENSDAVGGTARLSLSQATASPASITADAIVVSSHGEGGYGTGAGTGTGGTVQIDISGGNLSANSLYAYADGVGGGPLAGSTGGDGFGGTADMTVSGGTVSLTTVDLMANGRGGGSSSDMGAPEDNGGDGTGGQATLRLADGSLTSDRVTVAARGLGGSGGYGSTDTGNGGNGTGGEARILIDPIADAVIGTLEAIAHGSGGEGGSLFPDYVSGDYEGIGGAGGTGTGGIAAITIAGDTALGNLELQSVTADASAFGGSGGTYSGGFVTDGSALPSSPTPSGGAAQGGEATLSITGTAEAFGNLTALANAEGGSAAEGPQVSAAGDATGGIATIAIDDALYDGSIIDVQASAFGGAGASSDLGALGDGGSATGGSARLSVTGADTSVTATGTYVTAGATGGSGAAGGSATGGDATFELTDADYLARENVDIRADATGGSALMAYDGSSGIAGAATGGTSLASVGGSEALLSTSTLRITASGQGGGAEGGGTGGSGTGGEASFRQDDGTADLFSLDIAAAGAGGAAELSGPGFGGNGGSGTGGSATARIGAGAFSADSATVDASGTGAAGAGNFAGNAGSGGTGTGGDATFEILTGATATIGDLRALAVGTGGAGGTVAYFDFGYGTYDYADDPGTAGAGSGGIATIRLEGEAGGADLVSVGTVTADARGLGGDGGQFELQLSPTTGGRSGIASSGTGAGGDATGGTASITVAFDGVTLGAATVDADAMAGDGSRRGPGGAGGDATGGTAGLQLVDGSLELGQASVTARATGGNGADGKPYGQGGGAGGNATGGTATIGTMTDTAATSTLQLSVSALVSADAQGGNGGNGSFGTLTSGEGGGAGGGIGGSGGAGGNATGGTAELRAEGGLLLISTGPGEIPFPPPTFTLSALGTGGDGGDGAGGQAFGDTGGDGGDGTGGIARTVATGGGIGGSSLTLRTDGFGGDGGDGGTGATFAGTPGDPDATPPIPPEPPIPGVTKPQGAGGNGTGGTSQIAVADTDDAFGLTSFADVQMLANGQGGLGSTEGGSTGGFISIRDESTRDEATDPSGSIILGNLTAQAGPSGGDGFHLFSTDGAVQITGDATITVGGPVRVEAVGSGGLNVGGLLTIDTQSDVYVTHAGQPGAGTPFDTVHAGSIGSTSFSGFVADPGARIVAEDSISILNFTGTSSIADLSALNSILVQTGGDLFVGDALVTATAFESGNEPVGGSIRLYAGVDFSGAPSPSAGPDSFVPATLGITGTVQATAFVDLASGGDVVVENGGSVLSDNRITIRSGDDILVRSEGLVRAAGNPLETGYGSSGPFDTPARLLLSAGSISVTGSTDPADIASVIVDGTIAAPGRAIGIIGDAIQVQGQAIDSRDLFAEVNAPPPPGAPLSDDLGQLSAECAQGNICLSNILATGVVAIGQEERPISVRLASGDVEATDIAISARETIQIGGGEGTTRYSATNSLRLDSFGDVDLVGDTTLTGTTLQIVAGGSLLGTGTLESAGDVGITVGDSVSAMRISAGGEITTADAVGGPLEGAYSVAGDFTVGEVSVGAGGFTLSTGRSIDIGSVEVPDGLAIDLVAGTSAYLGSATGAGSIGIEGDSVGFGALDASGGIDLLARTGDISGGSLNAGTSILLNADGNGILLDTASAGIGFDAFAASLTAGTVEAGAYAAFDIDGDMTVGQVTTLGVQGHGDSGLSDILLDVGGMLRAGTLNAADRITGTIGAGLSGVPSPAARGEGGSVLASGGDISLDIVGDALIQSADAGGSISITTSGSNEFGTMDAGLNIFLTSGGGLAGDSAVAGAYLSASAGADGLVIDNVEAPGALFLDSLGDVSVQTGTSGLNFGVRADGDVSLGTVTTTGIEFGYGGSSDMDIRAGGSIDLGSATVADDIFLYAGTGTSGAGPQTIDVDSASAGGDFVADAPGRITLGTITTRGEYETGYGGGAILSSDITVSSRSGVSLATGNSAEDILISAGTDVVATDLTAEGDVGVTAGTDIGAGTIDAGGSISLTFGGDAAVATSATAGGDFLADGGGRFDFGAIEAAGLIGIDTDGPVDGTSAEAGGVLGITSGASIAVGTATTGDTAFITADGDVDIGSITAFDTVVIRAGGAASVDSGQAGDDFLVEAGTDAVLGQVTTLGNETGYGAFGGSNIVVMAGGGVAAGTLDAFDDVRIEADGALTGLTPASGATLIAGEEIRVATGGGASILSGEAGLGIVIDSGGGLDFGTLDAGASIDIDSQGVTGGTATAGGSIDIDSGLGVTITSAAAGGFVSIAAGTQGIDAGSVTAGETVSLTSSGAVAVDTGEAGDDFLVDAGTNALLGDIRTLGETGYGTSDILVDAGGNVALGSLDAFDNIAITAGGSLTGTTPGSSGGALAAGGRIGIDAGGAASILSGDAGLDISILTGGALDFGDLTAGTYIDIDSQGVTGDSATAADYVDIRSGLGVDIGSILAGSAIFVDAGDGAAVGSATAGNGLFIDAGSGGIDAGSLVAGDTVLLTSLGDIAVDSGQAGGDFVAEAGGAVTLGAIVTTGAEVGYGGEGTGATGAILVSAGGDVAATSLTAFGAIDIESGGDVTGGSLRAGSTLGVRADGAFSASLARATGATGSGNVDIDADGGITVETLAAAGSASLTAQDGAILVSDDVAVLGSVTALGRSVDLIALGTLRIASATATAGDIALTTGGDTNLNGPVSATGALGVDAGGTIRVVGLADAATIRLASDDIDIGPSGQVGTIARTTLVDITNNGTRRTFIGGSGGNAGYDLSAAELSRIFSGDIFVHAPAAEIQSGASLASSNPPDVVIGSFTLTSRALNAGGNLGAGGTFGIDTPGKMRVVGDVTFSGMGADNRVELAATEALEIDTAGGAIGLYGGDALAGTLSLDSDDIFAGNLTALGDIAGLTDMEAIDERLGLNDGTTSDAGAIQAGGLEVRAVNGFYVQNMGVESRNLDDRRGFTVGTGGLTITTAGPDTRIVINGRQVNPADGGFFTGIDLIPQVRIVDIDGQSGQFDQGSTINGCLIASPAACAFIAPSDPTRDVINEITDPGNVTVDPIDSPLVELRDLEGFGFLPLIDEPVTGAGNDDLWTDECENDPTAPVCKTKGN